MFHDPPADMQILRVSASIDPTWSCLWREAGNVRRARQLVKQGYLKEVEPFRFAVTNFGIAYLRLLGEIVG